MRAGAREQESQYSFRRHRSGAAEWAAVVLFMVLAVVVLLGAVAVLVVVLLLQPRVSYVAVRAGWRCSAPTRSACPPGASSRWRTWCARRAPRFFWPNGTVLPFRCISKSKFLFF